MNNMDDMVIYTPRMCIRRLVEDDRAEFIRVHELSWPVLAAVEFMTDGSAQGSAAP